MTEVLQNFILPILLVIIAAVVTYIATRKGVPQNRRMQLTALLGAFLLGTAIGSFYCAALFQGEPLPAQVEAFIMPYGATQASLKLELTSISQTATTFVNALTQTPILSTPAPTLSNIEATQTSDAAIATQVQSLLNDLTAVTTP